MSGLAAIELETQKLLRNVRSSSRAKPGRKRGRGRRGRSRGADQLRARTAEEMLNELDRLEISGDDEGASRSPSPSPERATAEPDPTLSPTTSVGSVGAPAPQHEGDSSDFGDEELQRESSAQDALPANTISAQNEEGLFSQQQCTQQRPESRSSERDEEPAQQSFARLISSETAQDADQVPLEELFEVNNDSAPMQPVRVLRRARSKSRRQKQTRRKKKKGGGRKQRRRQSSPGPSTSAAAAQKRLQSNPLHLKMRQASPAATAPLERVRMQPANDWGFAPSTENERMVATAGPTVASVDNGALLASSHIDASVRAQSEHYARLEREDEEQARQAMERRLEADASERHLRELTFAEEAKRVQDGGDDFIPSANVTTEEFEQHASRIERIEYVAVAARLAAETKEAERQQRVKEAAENAAANIMQAAIRGRAGRAKARKVAAAGGLASYEMGGRSDGNGLQTEWREVYDPKTGDLWYYNPSTGESQWEIPLELGSHARASDSRGSARRAAPMSREANKGKSRGGVGTAEGHRRSRTPGASHSNSLPTLPSSQPPSTAPSLTDLLSQARAGLSTPHSLASGRGGGGYGARPGSIGGMRPVSVGSVNDENYWELYGFTNDGSSVAPNRQYTSSGLPMSSQGSRPGTVSSEHGEGIQHFPPLAAASAEINGSAGFESAGGVGIGALEDYGYLRDGGRSITSGASSQQTSDLPRLKGRRRRQFAGDGGDPGDPGDDSSDGWGSEQTGDGESSDDSRASSPGRGDKSPVGSVDSLGNGEGYRGDGDTPLFLPDGTPDVKLRETVANALRQSRFDSVSTLLANTPAAAAPSTADNAGAGRRKVKKKRSRDKVGAPRTAGKMVSVMNLNGKRRAQTTATPGTRHGRTTIGSKRRGKRGKSRDPGPPAIYDVSHAGGLASELVNENDADSLAMRTAQSSGSFGTDSTPRRAQTTHSAGKRRHLHGKLNNAKKTKEICFMCWSAGDDMVKHCELHDTGERKARGEDDSVMVCAHWDIGALRRKYRAEEIQEIFAKANSSLRWDLNKKKFVTVVQAWHPMYRAAHELVAMFNRRVRRKDRVFRWFASVTVLIRTGQIGGLKAEKRASILKARETIANHRWVQNFKRTVDLLEPKAPLTEDDILLLGRTRGKGGIKALDVTKGYRIVWREKDKSKPSTRPRFIIAPTAKPSALYFMRVYPEPEMKYAPSPFLRSIQREHTVRQQLF